MKTMYNIKRLILILISVILIIISSGCAHDILYVRNNSYCFPNYPGAIKRVAVLDFEGSSAQKSRMITNLIMIELINKGIEVVEREQIYRVIDEQAMSINGFVELSDTQKAEKLGKILNADLIITGNIVESVSNMGYQQYQRNYYYMMPDIYLITRAIDTKTGAVVWEGTNRAFLWMQRGKYGNSLTVFKEVTKELVDSILSKKTDKKNIRYVDRNIISRYNVSGAR